MSYTTPIVAEISAEEYARQRELVAASLLKCPAPSMPSKGHDARQDQYGKTA